MCFLRDVGHAHEPAKPDMHEFCDMCDATEVKGGPTLLMLATQSGSRACVQNLLRKNCSVHEACAAKGRFYRMTALHFAAALKFSCEFASDIIRDLVRAGADVHATDGYGRGVLHHAAQAGNPATFQELISKGARLHPTSNGMTVLHCASSVAVVKSALLAGACVDARSMNMNRSAAHTHAAWGRHADILACLVAARADIEARDSNGDRPLHLAAAHRNPGSARRLISLGAELSPANKLGETPLHAAARRGSSEIVRLLLGRGVPGCTASRKGITPLLLAAERGECLIVAELLKRASPDRAGGRSFRFADAESPLHAAAKNGHAKVVELLLEAGADPCQEGKLGETPVHAVACHPALLSCLETLLRHCTPRALEIRAGASGCTPLMLASANANYRAVVALTRAGARVNRMDGAGRTPLYLAMLAAAEAAEWPAKSTTEAIRCVLHLLAAGARADLGHWGKTTAIHAAVRLKAHSLILPLIWAGADPCAVDAHDAVPVFVAARDSDCIPCLEILSRVSLSPEVYERCLSADRESFMREVGFVPSPPPQAIPLMARHWETCARGCLPGDELGLQPAVVVDVMQWMVHGAI